MTTSSLKIRMVLGAGIALASLAPLPALAQYDDDGYGGGYQQEYHPHHYNAYRPHCYYRNVKVYDDYYGRYVIRRQRVCDQQGY